MIRDIRQLTPVCWFTSIRIITRVDGISMNPNPGGKCSANNYYDLRESREIERIVDSLVDAEGAERTLRLRREQMEARFDGWINEHAYKYEYARTRAAVNYPEMEGVLLRKPKMDTAPTDSALQPTNGGRQKTLYRWIGFDVPACATSEDLFTKLFLFSQEHKMVAIQRFFVDFQCQPRNQHRKCTLYGCSQL